MAQIIVSIISVSIASIALVFSWLTRRMARRNFHLSNRPYVTVRNHVGEDTGVQNPRVMELICIKTPAKVTCAELRLYRFSVDEGREIGEECRISKEPLVILPAEQNPPTMIIPGTVNLPQYYDLRMEVDVKYEWAGTDEGKKEYSFCGVWRYESDVTLGRWEIIDQDIT